MKSRYSSREGASCLELDRMVGQLGGGPPARIQLRAYVDLLYFWSEKVSLISAGDRNQLVQKHVIPAVSMIPLIRALPHATILDFGSGAGLPGIPLKIMLPDARVVLLDGRRRRTSFLRQVVRQLELKEVEVVNARIESWCGPAGGVDMVVSRAVASPGEVAEQADHLLAGHGHVVTALSTQLESAHDPRIAVHHTSWSGGESRFGVLAKRAHGGA